MKDYETSTEGRVGKLWNNIISFKTNNIIIENKIMRRKAWKGERLREMNLYGKGVNLMIRENER